MFEIPKSVIKLLRAYLIACVAENIRDVTNTKKSTEWKEDFI